VTGTAICGVVLGLLLVVVSLVGTGIFGIWRELDKATQHNEDTTPFGKLEQRASDASSGYPVIADGSNLTGSSTRAAVPTPETRRDDAAAATRKPIVKRSENSDSRSPTQRGRSASSGPEKSSSTGQTGLANENLGHRSPSFRLAPNKEQDWGTGVIVGSDGFVLTCGHVVKDAAKTFVRNRRFKCSAEVVGLDEQRDLALLRVEKNGLAKLPVNPSTSSGGETIYILGFGLTNNGHGQLWDESMSRHVPRLVAASFRDGPDDNARPLRLTIPINPGFSGGPVIDQHGNLVALANADWAGGGNRPTCALRIQQAFDFLDQHRVQYQRGGAPVVMNAADLLAHCIDAVVCVSIIPETPLPKVQHRDPNVPRRMKAQSDPGTLTMRYTPDGSMIAAASRDIRLLDADTLSLRETLKGHEADVQSLSFSPKGDMLASVDATGKAIIWKVPNAVLWNQLAGIAEIEFTSDGTCFAARVDEPRSDGNTTVHVQVRIWDAESGGIRHEIAPETLGKTGRMQRMAVFNRSPRLLTAGHFTDRISGKVEHVHVWDTSSGRLVATLAVDEFPRFVRRVAISRDDRRLAVGGADLNYEPGVVRVYDMKSMRTLYSVTAPATGPGLGGYSLFFSPADRFLAVGEKGDVFKHGIRLYEVSTGAPVWKMTGSHRAAAFSPDEARFAQYYNIFHQMSLWDMEATFARN
jgi:S1-C subfamily serine protease